MTTHPDATSGRGEVGVILLPAVPCHAPTATVIADTLTRLVGSMVIAPKADLDLHDATTLRAYATRIVPAVIRGC
jgi:hypothetical protein